MRLSPETWQWVSRLLTPNSRVELDYHQRRRTGRIDTIGEGPKGPFLTVETPEGYRNFSLSEVESFRLIVPSVPEPPDDEQAQ